MVGMIVMACARPPAGTPPSGAGANVAAPVVVSPVRQATITQSISATGNVVALSVVSVTPKQAGRIEKLNVDVGSKVSAGEVIAQLDHRSQDLSLESAKAQLEAAQAKLAGIDAGPRDETVRQAQLSVDNAQAKLQALQSGAKPATVAPAQASADSAKAKLVALQAQGNPNAVRQAQANLDAAGAKLQALKNGPRPEAVVPIQLAVSQTKNLLFSAQVSRDAACAHPGAACLAANASVDAAQTSVDQANANLKAMLAPPTATDLQQAQAAVNQAQSALDAAKAPYTAQDIRQAQDAVQQAEANVALAEQPNTPQDLQQAQNAVDAAVQQLNLTKQPFTAQDRQGAQAGVDQAQAGVDQAQQGVSDTTVTAPIPGVISQVNLSAGALATTASPIVSISSDALKVQVPIEDTQLPDLKLGDSASISGAALGSKSVAGKVTGIAPSASAQSRTFTVDVTPDQPADLLPGMFVRVAIAVQEHQNATAVPTSAVIQNANGTFVFVVQNGVAHQVPVEIGLASATLTEVTKGVSSGQSVVVQGQQGLTDGDRVTVSPAASG